MLGPLLDQARGFAVASLCLAMVAGAPDFSYAQGFDTRLLRLDRLQGVNLDAFQAMNQVLPGTYEVTLVINGRSHGKSTVVFNNPGPNLESAPCITAGMLQRAGIRPERIEGIEPERCVDLGVIAPHAAAHFDSPTQTLHLNLPQAYLMPARLVRIDPQHWQDGETTAHLNYRVEAVRNAGHESNPNSVFADWQAGVNVGPWRARSLGSVVSRREQTEAYWGAAYLERGLSGWNSLLRLGDFGTELGLGNSIQMRGFRLGTDIDMLPPGLVAYAPVLRGVARTNAEVLVSRAGRVVYATHVPPGPFEIADAPLGSGEVTVTVREADGSEQTFVQGGGALPVMLPTGQSRFELALGQAELRDARPTVLFGALRYGWLGGLTVYGDLTATGQFQSSALGIGADLGRAGAISVDLSAARSAVPATGSSSGLSVRMLFQKTFGDTGTGVQLAGYRYSTSGYRNLDEAYSVLDLAKRRRQRVDLVINQALADIHAYASGAYENYWAQPGRALTLNAGVSGSWRNLLWSLSYWRTSSPDSSNSPLLRLSLQIPLERVAQRNTSASYSLNRSLDSGLVEHQVGLNGRGRGLDYSAQFGYRTADHATTSAALRAGLDSGRGRIELGYSRSADGSETSLIRAEGSLLVHGDGLTLGPVAREGMILVETGGVSGVELNASGNPVTDSRGYALVPMISPYRINQVTIRPETLPEDVHVSQPSASVIPTRGAVTRVSLSAIRGGSRFVRLTDAKGTAVPFGSMVRDSANRLLGIVGRDGDTFLEGVTEGQSVRVELGAGQTCSAELNASSAERPRMPTKCL